MKKQIEFYEIPEVEIVEINVEKGFANSTETDAGGAGSGNVPSEDEF